MPSFVVLIALTGEKKLHILLKGLKIITTMNHYLVWINAE